MRRMKRIMIIALLAIMAMGNLAASPYFGWLYSIGIGLGSDVVMTDLRGNTQAFEDLSCGMEFAFLPQDDPWNFVVKLNIGLFSQDAIGLRPGTPFYSPTVDCYAIIRYQTQGEKGGFGLGLGGGIYAPCGEETPVYPLVVAEPSWLFATRMRTNPNGWLRLSMPVGLIISEFEMRLTAGLGVTLYFW